MSKMKLILSMKLWTPNKGVCKFIQTKKFDVDIDYPDGYANHGRNYYERVIIWVGCKTNS